MSTSQIDTIKAALPESVSSALGALDYQYGISVWGGDRVNITCQYDPDDIRNAYFTSANHREFNYVANGKWEQWVELAKAILKVDALTTEPGAED